MRKQWTYRIQNKFFSVLYSLLNLINVFFQKIYHLTDNFQDIDKNLKNSSLKNGMYNLLLHVANAT